MSRRSKTIIAISVSLILLYYGVASAGLSCCHGASHSHEELTATPTHEVASTSQPVDAEIDCIAPVYHTESLAGPPRATVLDPASHPEYRPIPEVAREERTASTWLELVLETGTSRTFLVNTLVYLSLLKLQI